MKISVPLHITGFFSPHFSDNSLLAGSIGAGLVIMPGITCVCKFSDKKRKKNKTIYNGIEKKIKPIETVLKLLNLKQGVSIKISSPVSLGLGYGSSAASTLAVSLSLCRFLDKTNLSPLRRSRLSKFYRGRTSANKLNLLAARIAHQAEVESLTGLGDVSAIFSGKDLTVRIKPGAPGIGIVKSLKQAKNLRVVAADLKRINTEKMLKSINSDTYCLGLEFLKKFRRNPDLVNFFKYSQLFAKKAGFADEKFFKKLEPLKRYCLGFSVKKGVLFAVAKQGEVKNAVPILKKISRNVHIFRLGGGID